MDMEIDIMVNRSIRFLIGLSMSKHISKTGKKYNVSYDELWDLIRTGKTNQEIGSIVGCSAKSIASMRREYGLPCRYFQSYEEKYGISDEWVKEQYLVQKKSIEEIACEVGVNEKTMRTILLYYGCLQTTAHKLLDKYQISEEWLVEQRTLKARTYDSICQECGMSKTTLVKICKELGISLPEHSNAVRHGITYDALYEMYISRCMTASEIASDLNISKSIVYELLKEFNIDKSERPVIDYSFARGSVEPEEDMEEIPTYLPVPVQKEHLSPYVPPRFEVPKSHTLCDKYNVDPNEVVRLRVHDLLPYPEIAEHCNVTKSTMYNIFMELGLDKVPFPKQADRIGINKKWLEEQCRVFHKTDVDLAREFGVGDNLFFTLRKKYGIKAATKISTLEKYRINPEWLHQQRYVLGRTIESIAEQLDMERVTVRKMLKEARVPEPNSASIFEQYNVEEKQICDDYKHLTYKQISLKYEIPLRDVLNMIKYLNIKEKISSGELDVDVEWVKRQLRSRYLKDIANELGIDPHVMSTFCQIQGIRVSRSKDKEYGIDVEWLRHQREAEGRTYREIGDEIGVSRDIISSICRTYGIDSKDNSVAARLDIDREWLYTRYYVEHQSFTTLAEELNIPVNTLRHIYQKYGLPKRESVSHAKRFGITRQRLLEEFSKIPRTRDSISANLDIAPSMLDLICKEENIVPTYIPHEYSISAGEQRWIEFLDENGIAHTEHAMCLYTDESTHPREIDILIERHTIGVEISPAYTHNHDAGTYWGNKPKKSSYHQLKAKAGDAIGINVIQVFDWYDEHALQELIKSYCRPDVLPDEDMKNVEVQKSSVIKDFLEGYGFDRYCEDEKTIYYGILQDEELVFLVGFSQRATKTRKWDITAYAQKKAYSIGALLAKTISCFIEKHSPRQLNVSVNYDISNGTEWERLGFKYVKTTRPGYVWVKNDGSKHYVYAADAPKDVPGMIGDGFVRVYDCGKKIYTLDVDDFARETE